MANFKNPLTMAFGMVLKKIRGLLGTSNADEFAKAMDLGATYYRSVEAGINNLSPLHSLKIIKAFHNSPASGGRNLSYEALTIYLSTLSYHESLVKADEMPLTEREKYAKHLLNIRTEAGARLKDLLSTFEVVLHKLQGVEEIEKLIKDYGADTKLWDYLTHYKVYGQTAIERDQETENTFLDDLPTIYFDFLKSTKEELKKLPVKVGFPSLWQWEERNKQNFASIFCLFTGLDDVTSLDNLRRYKYKYLWEPQFKEAHFLYTPDVKSNDVAKKFQENLKTSLEESRDIELLKDFDKANKVVFAHASETLINHKEITELLTGNSYDINQPGKKVYNAIWVFTMVPPHQSVGFMAEIDPNDNLIKEGISLTYKEVTEKLRRLVEMWDKVNSKSDV